jgi:hypothetical protein
MTTTVERQELGQGGAESIKTRLLAVRVTAEEQEAFAGIARLLRLSTSELLRAGACSVLLRVLDELTPAQRARVEVLVEGLAYSQRSRHAERQARLRSLAGLAVDQEAA